MQSNRSNTLGGEGCPAADIPKPAQNRNISDAFGGRPMQARASSSRTVQEQTGSADTPLTQRTGFRVRDVREAFEAWADRRVLTPAEAKHVAHAINYLAVAEQHPLPACLRVELAQHVEAISKSVL